jgi:hypothetical protein
MKRHGATAMDIVLIPTRPLECIVLKTVHRVPIIVKQLVPLFREVHRDVTVVQRCTHVLRTRQYLSNASSNQCNIR